MFKRSLMKHVAANAGESADTSRDWDYTNWQQVDAFADRNSGGVRAGGRQALMG